MDVLVRGMKMPNTCEECEFASWSNLCQTMWCNRIEEPTGEDFSQDYKVKRAEFCPLVPVPSHGRLIDADALTDDLEFDVRNDQRVLDELKKDSPDEFTDINIATTQDDKDIKQNCIELIKGTKTIIEASE